jgi:spore coat polysaccharide biosynthesis protein SpsF (cytidylyltransferase family)
MPTDAFGQWCRTDAVRRADRIARQPHARAQATAALWSRPEVFRAKLLPLPKELEGEGVELSLDWQNNWEHTEALLDAYAESDLDWRRIVPLLRRTDRAAA